MSDNYISIDGIRYAIHQGTQYSDSCKRCALKILCKDMFTEEGICQVFDAGFNDYFVKLNNQ